MRDDAKKPKCQEILRQDEGTQNEAYKLEHLMVTYGAWLTDKNLLYMNEIVSWSRGFVYNFKDQLFCDWWLFWW